MKRARIEWNAVQICAIVFGCIGAVFTVLGTVFGITIEAIAASPHSRGNVYVLPWVFGLLGAAFLLVFAVLFFVSKKRKQLRRRLVQNGRYIYALVTEVKQDLFVQVNHRHPYYIVCEGALPYTGEKRMFKSANTMDDPSQLLGRQVRVFLDDNDPTKYYVEVFRDYDM